MAISRPLPARESGPLIERQQSVRADVDERNQLQCAPKDLGPKLKSAEKSEAVRYERNDDQRTQQISSGKRQAEAHLQSDRHDRRFQSKKDEGERGVDERCDRRADIAKSSASREKVDVDSVFCGIVADWQTERENDRADNEDRSHRIRKTIV